MLCLSDGSTGSKAFMALSKQEIFVSDVSVQSPVFVGIRADAAKKQIVKHTSTAIADAKIKIQYRRINEGCSSGETNAAAGRSDSVSANAALSLYDFRYEMRTIFSLRTVLCSFCSSFDDFNAFADFHLCWTLPFLCSFHPFHSPQKIHQRGGHQ